MISTTSNVSNLECEQSANHDSFDTLHKMNHFLVLTPAHGVLILACSSPWKQRIMIYGKVAEERVNSYSWVIVTFSV